MDLILEEIKKAKDSGLCYVALSMVLTLPDVCAFLELSRETHRDDYKKWCVDNLNLKELTIDENVLYQFRCRLSHNASIQKGFKRYLITYPFGGLVHGNIGISNSGVDINKFYSINKRIGRVSYF